MTTPQSEAARRAAEEIAKAAEYWHQWTPADRLARIAAIISKHFPISEARAALADDLDALIQGDEVYNTETIRKARDALRTLPAAQPTGIAITEQDIEVAVGGAYEMPDGRKFWNDAPVAREIARRVWERMHRK